MVDMSYIGLRDWLEAVEARGEVKRISGADWNLEMTSIVELVYKQGKAPKPTLIFDDIPGYPKGYRTLFGLLSSPWRIAKTLGLSENELSPFELLSNWRKKNRDLVLISTKNGKDGTGVG